ncbi:deleted in lung and esophageal cancer protein 1-like [Asterias amurensis]|uniref:deleted in lung and esophageal cancer protein 1-like n=1 Tax=Asterias amurensis TaxID=7602 RepID=UPI003AB7A757
MSTKLGRLPYDEPPMYLQRPSSGRSQDVTHVLARTFRDLFTRDFVEQETVRNLNKSRSGDDTYHEKYVEDLRKIQAERERRMAEALMLERHIMQARARSMAADERELNKAAEGCDIYHDLGLPPVDSNLENHLDSDLLRKHGLIVPEDYSTAEPALAHAPKASRKPRYAEATDASNVRVHHTEDEFHVQEGGGHVTPGSQAEVALTDTAKPWQGTTSPQTRERNRTDLAMVHKKSDFKRNPRHRPPSTLSGGKTLTKPNTVTHQLGGAKSTVIDTAIKEPSVVFLANPSTVVFTEYQVGRVYELPLELKNISTASRPLRIIPPKSQFFSVGLGKFPGEHGIVAPGMSCQYNIRFMPDSLMDFNDVITIQTQSSQPLVIKLQGRRPPPILSLSKDIDCGHCLIGGRRTVQFLIKNAGGSGRFCLMPRESWPTTNFKSATNSSKVDLAPFQIQPAILELLAGHTIPIQVTFTPTSVKHFSRDITMVCDNCTVKHFTIKGEGQTAGVELQDVSGGGESHSSPGEMSDATAQHQVRFDPINPMTFTTKQLTIKNTTNVELPFHWELLRPHLECPGPQREEENGEILGGGIIQRLKDESNIFCINPDRGVLAPQGVCRATVAYAPLKIGAYHSVLHLVLKEVPKERQLSAASSQGDDPKEEITPNERSARRSGAVQVSDVVGLEVELKGECEEYKVLVHPYAIFVPGQLLVSTTIRKPFQMSNHSKFPAHFAWTNHSEGHIIEVETPQGTIPPESTIHMELALSGAHPGRIDHTLLCHIEHQERAVPMRVIADIKGPTVIIDTPAIDFGLVRFGERVVQEMHIRNTSQVPASWSVRESKEFILEHPQSGEIFSEFTLMPSCGDLPPLGSKVIKVTFEPVRCRRIQSVFECNILDGNNSFVGVRANVEHPLACLLSSHLAMDEVYVGVPVTTEVTIVNQTKLSADFCWQKPLGSQAGNCNVTFDPCKGRLGPRENLKVAVTFVGHIQGVLDDVKIPCYIQGMGVPLVLALITDVRGLTVTYLTPHSGTDKLSEDNLLLDFGKDVELGSTPSRLVHITNHTAIAAPFHIAVEHFESAKPPSPPEKETKDQSKRRGLLSRTSNLADPQSRTPSQIKADYAKAVLRDNRGVAFVVSPASGVLEPFSQLAVSVEAFSDMWGSYTENLICKVSDLAPVVIPIEMTVTGCPLCFSMATLKGQLPIVRFGTHIAGLPKVLRPLKIRNNSPCDVRVDWQIFNLTENDSTLVDLLVNIGEPFPLRDENGREIVPPSPEQESPQPVVEIPAGQAEGDASLLSKVTKAMEGSSDRGSEGKGRLISVVLREHEGEPGERGPFTVCRQQMVIPARGSLQMAAAFDPQFGSLIMSGTDCIGYGLGFMSLDTEGAREVVGKVTRSQGHEMIPLRLDFTAYLKPALLTVETVDDEGMRYHTAASDLLHPDDPARFASPFFKGQAANLTNATQTPLAFRLVTPDPFVLLSTEPGSGKGRTPLAAVSRGDQLIGLPPQKNLQMKVAFQLCVELLELSLFKLRIGEEHNGFSLTQHEEERRLIIRKDLEIHYSNSAVQKLPLYAMIIIPSIKVTPSQLDFGTCLVSQQRQLEVIINNPTGSASRWTVQSVADQKEGSENIFDVVPSTGFLEAHITHVSRSKVTLKVHFTARHNIPYKGKFIFKGMLGEIPQELEVKGEGSYDSRHEALVDV